MNQEKFRLCIVILFAVAIVTVWVGMLANMGARRSTMSNLRRAASLRQPAMSRQTRRPTLPQPRPTTRPQQPAQTAPETQK